MVLKSAPAASAQAVPLSGTMMFSRDTIAAVREGETPGSADNDQIQSIGRRLSGNASTDGGCTASCISVARARRHSAHVSDYAYGIERALLLRGSAPTRCMHRHSIRDQ